jgi:putative methyltransferase
MSEEKALCDNDYASPYLDGWFDGFFEKYPDMEFNTIIETSRGCPNRCAYCDWGLLKEKTRFFPLDKVFAEIEWMGRNKIRFVWGADANFGISADDLLIADAFVNTKEKYGYPERVRINYSKSNRERVLEIVRRFNRKGIDRAGATISLQSLSPVVLENIGRKNMSLEHFQKDFGVYHEENLQVYSELILGLPGETYDSFADGICKLFEIGQHFIFEVYNCIVLPNSILGQTEYMKKFGIKTSNSEIVRYHCAADAYYIPEKTNIITETDSMPCNMWQKSAAFGGFTQAMHGCGLLRCFAIYAYYELQKSYRSFYEGLTEYIENGNAPFTSGVFKTVKDYFASLAQGENPRLTVPFAGNLVWENYEYIFLNLCGNLDLFYEEMMPYLSSVIEDGSILSQLYGYQRAVLRKPDEKSSVCEAEIDFYNYFKKIYVNEYEPPVKGKFRIRFTDSDPASGWEEFGKKVVWYGKMGSRSYKDKIEIL